METFAQWSDAAFSAPEPFDLDADLNWLERLSSGSGFGAAFDAARERMRAIEAVNADDVVREDWFDTAVDRVKAATGVMLENPMRISRAGPADPEVFAQGLFGIGALYDRPSQAVREDEFFRKVSDLTTAHPDLADLTPESMDASFAARGRAAEARSSKVWNDRAANPALKFAGTIAGSLWGGIEVRDPQTVLSLIAAGSGWGSSVLARIATEMLVQGGIGGSTTAVAQPKVQAWRAKLGLEHGWAEAGSNIVMGTVTGAAFGATFRALGESVPAVARLLSGEAKPAEVPALIEEARRAGAFISDNDAAVLKRAAEVDEANAALIAARPPEVPEHAAGVQLADGLAAAGNPDAPLPLVDPPIPPGTADDLARGFADLAASPREAVEALRAHDGAVLSALASDDPQLRDLGRIATLDPDLAARVFSGELDPVHGAIIAATTADPAEQAAVATVLIDFQPRDAAAARTIATDVVAAARAPQSAAAMAGALPFGPRIAAKPETWMAAVAQARALETGEIVGGLHHPGLGEISVPWRVPGDPNHGLAGLIARGRGDVIALLPDIVATGRLEMGRTRARIRTADHTAVIRLDYRVDRASPTLEKKWLFTAFEHDRPPEKFAPSPGLQSEAVSSPRSPDIENMSAEAGAVKTADTGDVKDAVPIRVRDDNGNESWMTRAALDRVAERDRWIRQVIDTCKD